MKTISVKQPWAYLICSGIKDIENRKWKTNYRGKVLIHSPIDVDKYGLELVSNNVKLYKSAIIGSVEIIDCVKEHKSLWAEKDSWNWVLSNPIVK